MLRKQLSDISCDIEAGQESELKVISETELIRQREELYNRNRYSFDEMIRELEEAKTKIAELEIEAGRKSELEERIASRTLIPVEEVNNELSSVERRVREEVSHEIGSHLELQLRDANGEKRLLEGKIKHLIKLIGASDNASIEEEIVKLISEISNLRRENEDLRNNSEFIVKLSDNLREAENRINNFHLSESSLRRELDNAHRKISDLERSSNTQATVSNSALESEIRGLKSEIDSVSRQNQSMRQTIDSLNVTLEIASNQSLEQTALSLKRANNELKIENQSLKAATESRTTISNNSNDSQVFELSRKLTEAQTHIDSLNRKEIELERELQQANRDNYELKSKLVETPVPARTDAFNLKVSELEGQN